MITWPHLGLYGDFSPCEEGILQALNNNFLKLDVLVNGSVLDFVTELPEDPELGDTYVLIDSIYTDNNGPIMFFDGQDWVEITPKAGYMVYDESSGSYSYYNGSLWVEFPMSFGDVVGPNSSINNGMARFDGTTGKQIKGSEAILDDDRVISNLKGIYTDFVNTKFFDAKVSTDSSTGEDAEIPEMQSMVTKFNGALVSILNIAPPSDGLDSRIHVIVNDTGSTVSVKNSGNVITGQGADIAFRNQASLFVLYDRTLSKWRVIGGSGGGGGGITSIGDGSDPIELDLTEGFKESEGNLDLSSSDQVVYFDPGNTGMNEISASPQIQAGTSVGQRLTLVIESSLNLLRLKANLDLRMNGDWETYNIGDSITFMWNGSLWTEVGRNN